MLCFSQLAASDFVLQLGYAYESVLECLRNCIFALRSSVGFSVVGLAIRIERELMVYDYQLRNCISDLRS